ncbi:MAG: FeoA family protein [Flavobacteriaceae bacterium]
MILNSLEVSVTDLRPGQKGVIKDFAEEEIPVKLLELGCLPGNLLELVQVAPLNDPLYIDVNGSHIAIRRDVAKRIILELKEDSTTR